MTGAAASAAAVPALPRGVRLSADRVRRCTVLLGPERVVIIDAIGEAILTRIDGHARIAAICDQLAEAFDAPRDLIESDVLSYLQDLADKRLVELRHG